MIEIFRGNKKVAFSVIEIVIGMFILSILLAAFVPVISKRRKPPTINVKTQKQEISYDCSDISSDCMACIGNICKNCANSCGNNHYLEIKTCTCKDCPQFCDGCSSGKCTSCISGYFLEDNQCKPKKNETDNKQITGISSDTVNNSRNNDVIQNIDIQEAINAYQKIDLDIKQLNQNDEETLNQLVKQLETLMKEF